MRLLQFIAAQITDRGVAPSIREMSGFLGASSPATTHRLLKQLEERGHINRMPGRPRAISLGNLMVVKVPKVPADQLSDDALWQECILRGLISARC